MQAIVGQAGAVKLDNQLRQAFSLFHFHISSARQAFDQLGGPVGQALELFGVFAKNLDRDIGLGAGHQFIEAQLDGLGKFKLCPGYYFQCCFHFVGQLFPALGAHPFRFFLEDNHDIGVLNGHRVGGYFCRADFRNHVFYFREVIQQDLLRFGCGADAFLQRTAWLDGHLHGQVAFFQGRDEYRA